MIVDDLVLDVSAFAEHHPGGPAVIRANIGRDASADFAHVSAHDHPAVRRKIAQMAVASVYRRDLPESWEKVIDHLCLVRNSFELQLASPRDPMLLLIYCGQSYYQFMSDHLGVLVASLGRWAAQVPCLTLCPEQITAAVGRTVALDDEVTAIRLVEQIRRAIDGVLTPLIDTLTSATDNDRREQAALALRHIDGWLATEQSRWTNETPTA